MEATEAAPVEPQMEDKQRAMSDSKKYVEAISSELESMPPIVLEESLYKEEKLKKVMNQLLLQDPSNNICVECSQRDCEWASVSLGLYLCIGCSGHHRNLGVHISRVKSLFLDNWKKEEIEFMIENGNTKAKLQWESNLPPYFIKPGPKDSTPLKEQYIRAKYERKEFCGETAAVSTEIDQLPTKEGWLTKQGAVVKSWKKRWFVLSGTMLFYYKKQKDPEPTGWIELKDSQEVDCLEEPVENKTFCFKIETAARVFLITAESGKEMFDWTMKLRIAKQQMCADKTNRKNSSQFDLKEVAVKLSNAIAIQKRKINKKAFPNCFIGTSAVDWMMYQFEVNKRSEAVALCQKLLDNGFIQSVTGETQFADTYSLYQFLKTD